MGRCFGRSCPSIPKCTEDRKRCTLLILKLNDHAETVRLGEIVLGCELDGIVSMKWLIAVSPG